MMRAAKRSPFELTIASLSKNIIYSIQSALKLLLYQTNEIPLLSLCQPHHEKT